jgi:acylphosphatase
MCRLFRVTGRVQGVFFRVSTRDVAVPMNIAGHAINLSDGSVEVRACGEAHSIEQLHEWLHDGPRHASVTGVEELDTSCTNPDRFTTG